MHNESGRSLIEMMMVLALIGLMTIGSIKAYQSGNDQNEANKIHELVSIASLNGLTKMKDYNNSRVWDVIGKKSTDYKCVQSLETYTNGSVKIIFKSSCDKVKKTLTSQWGSSHWNDGTNIYTPPKDDE